MITLPNSLRDRRYLADQSTLAHLLEGCGFAGMHSVVDFGCGEGGWLWPLSRMANAVTGIDLSTAAIATAMAVRDLNQIDNVELQTSGTLEDVATSSVDGLIML